MNEITLSAQLVNSILGYLGTRPYQEVYQMINNIQAEAAKQAEASKPAE